MQAVSSRVKISMHMLRALSCLPTTSRHLSLVSSSYNFSTYLSQKCSQSRVQLFRLSHSCHKVAYLHNSSFHHSTTSSETKTHSIKSIHTESTDRNVQASFSSSATTDELKLPEEFKISPRHWNIKQDSYLRSVLPSSTIATMEEFLGPMVMMFTSTAIMGMAIGTLLTRFHMPYIWGHKVDTTSTKHGGEIVADVLKQHGVKYIFTVVGGHISPILVAAEKIGIRIVDTRHEVSTVFAADAVARMSGCVGVSVVTAGPGLTNTVTAVKNAQMAESPVLLIGGAAATILQGRGALQDIDQLALFKPLCKYTASVRCVRDIAPTLQKALQKAQSGTPGPVFVEFPIDVLYPYSTVSKEIVPPGPPAKNIKQKMVNWYLNNHLSNLYSGAWDQRDHGPLPLNIPTASHTTVEQCAQLLQGARKPVIVVGSQATLPPTPVDDTRKALERMGIPCFLGGMSRGLLGRRSAIQMRQKRGDCLKEADVIVLAGAVCDFRLSYGRSLNKKAKIISVNRDKVQLLKNSDMFWKPTIAVQSDVGTFLKDLSAAVSGYTTDQQWLDLLTARDQEKERVNAKMAAIPPPSHLNPVKLFMELEDVLPEDAVLVADGGDFVATASYILRPRGPLLWLDPGAFGTLGVGGGFALGAKLCRPNSQVWIIYGDGACGYSLSEFDTYVRHKIPLIAVVGNDAGWTQIAREQVPMFNSSVACDLEYTRYDKVVEGFGACGLQMGAGDDMTKTFRAAQELHDKEGKPVLLNAFIGKTNFREGSMSV